MDIKKLYKDDIEELFNRVNSDQLDILKVQRELSKEEWWDFASRYDSWYIENWSIKNYSELIQSM